LGDTTLRLQHRWFVVLVYQNESFGKGKGGEPLHRSNATDSLFQAVYGTLRWDKTKVFVESHAERGSQQKL
jgi:hypothetical protein